MTIVVQVLVILLLIASPIVLVIAGRRLMRNRARIAWLQARDYILLRILVPKNNEKTPLAAEQMFAALHGIYEPHSRFQEHLSFEIAAKDKYIQFYAWVPARLREFVEGQIYAQYPTAEIVHVDDYAKDVERVFPNLQVAGTELTLTANEVYPIKTFQNFEVDPLSGITSVISQVAEGEQIWIQILTRPTSDIWKTKGTAHISYVKTGTGGSLFSIILKRTFTFISALLHAVVSGPPPSEKSTTDSTATLPAGTETDLKSVETKIAKLGFSTKIRIMALAPTAEAARAKLSATVGVFKQFNTLNLNGFSSQAVEFGSEFLATYRSREFEDPGFILNIEELASLFHLPSKSVETPSIVWAGSKTGEPPSNLPIRQTVTDSELTVFGSTNYRTRKEEFGIKLRDRRYHMYAIGKTGTGKSTLLENMIIDDIQEGRGLAVVDPHGDLIAHVMRFIPESRIEDVVMFSPADSDYPVGFNPLENVNPELKSIVASGVVGIFKKIFGESWGPRLEYILRNTIMGLLEYPDATMLGIVRMLTNKEYRTKVVERVKDPVIKAFFVDEFERYDPKFRTEAIAPIQNKVGQFLSFSIIRNIIGQPRSTINISEIMDSGKILLIDLSIGKIGEDSAALLGAMMITKIQLASMQRAYVPEEERRDFYLYVDEFQNFATDSFAVILSEARKYRLNLIMTNQYIAQMPLTVASAVFGNIGTLVSFRVGAADANALVKEFEPVFDANDLVNLDNYHIYTKMSIDGVTSPAFSAQTLPPRKDSGDHSDEIIRRSREKYSRARSLVEAQIMEDANVEEKTPTAAPYHDTWVPPLRQSADQPADKPEGQSGDKPEEDKLQDKPLQPAPAVQTPSPPAPQQTVPQPKPSPGPSRPSESRRRPESHREHPRHYRVSIPPLSKDKHRGYPKPQPTEQGSQPHSQHEGPNAVSRPSANGALQEGESIRLEH